MQPLLRFDRALRGLATLAAIGIGVPPISVSAQVPATAPAAVEREALTLGAVYRGLQAANPRLAAAGAQARAAAARIGPARTLPDPQLQLGLMNRNFPGFGLSDPLGMNQIQVMQMVPFPGKLGLAGRVASEQAEAQRARTADVAWDVRAQAAMAYYEIYQMDQSLDVARETLRLLRDLAETARTMYAVGEGRQADVLRAQVEIARMEEEITRMEVERVSAAARLNALLARAADAPVGSVVLPAFPAALPPLDSLVAEAQARRPMVKAGEAEVRAADAGLRLARREIWPDFEVGVQYGQRPMEGGTTDRMVSLMVGVNVPIFAGSRQLAMRREAEAMRQMAAADLEAMRADTRGRVAELHAAVQRSQRLAVLYHKTILPQAETTVASALAAYRVGGVDFMTLLDNQMTVNRYRQDLYTLEAEQGQALAELEMLLGRALLDPDSTVLASGGKTK
ncbi:MAG: TolC family protein [Brachybacterium paraconglomeratum]|nr:TolC family protein [Brachybacterium paraconglomeratum]